MIQFLAHEESVSWFRLAWPPLHPLLVNFTAALVPVSVLADVLGRWLRRSNLSATGFWTIAIAAAITPFTALAGWWWLRQMPEMDMPPMPLHRWLGMGLAVAIIPLALWRSRTHRRANAPSTGYLITAGLLLLALILQAHIGATMSFGGSGNDHVEPSRSSSSASNETSDHAPAGHHDASNASTASTAPSTAAAVYTCPMHAEVTSDKPGYCPECGMKLVAKP